MDRRLLDVAFLGLIIGPIAYLEFMTAAYSGLFAEAETAGFPSSQENSDKAAAGA